jgi:hypothetical protein
MVLKIGLEFCLLKKEFKAETVDKLYYKNAGIKYKLLTN